MTISNFFVKKMQKLNMLYVLFSNATKNPYIECDPETYDDQVFAFASEAKAKEVMHKYNDEKKIVLGVAKIPNDHILKFIGSLFAFGVNALMFTDDMQIRIQLDQLLKKPDIEKLKADKIPRMNPDIQLTAGYFLQEIRRKDVERTQEEKVRVHQMEEEMAVNLFRMRFIIGIDLSENGGKLDKEHPNFKLPFVKLQNGDTYVPCFSDLSEFQKFQAKNKALKLSLIAVPYDSLLQFTKQSKGIVLNPAGFNLILSTPLLGKLKENYGGGEK